MQPENADPLFNGNISETRWVTGDEILRGYRYSYDALNRLNMAQWTGGTALADNPNVQEDYTEGPIAYDKNGNILELQRFGMRTQDPTIDKIDILTYSYLPSSNRLVKVTDAAGSDGFNNGASADDEDYRYDVNGNMTADRNKDIRTISYNHLNLPTLVRFRSGESILFVYDATGAKLRKSVTQSGLGNDVTTVTDYAGGFIYINGVLQHFGHAEGYVSYDAPNNKFKYIYQYKDHLGNSRVSFTDSSSNGVVVVEENHYYAFGLKHRGYGTATTGLGNAHGEQYKYNGKELQDELGLNWYDYGARNYDAAIGRWMNVDPLAEQGRRWSPYVYVINNPVFLLDPDGMWPENPFRGLLNKAKETVTKYVVNKATEIVKLAVAKTVGTVKSYINKQLINMVPSLIDGHCEGRSGKYGFDFGGDKDNAQNGMIRKDKGDRNTKQVDVSVLMELTNVHGPEGSRGQTPAVPTEASENSTSNNSPSAADKISDTDNLVEAERIKYSATPLYGGGYAAKSTIHTPTSTKVLVSKEEKAQIEEANTADSIRAANERDKLNRGITNH